MNIKELTHRLNKLENAANKSRFSPPQRIAATQKKIVYTKNKINNPEIVSRSRSKEKINYNSNGHLINSGHRSSSANKNLNRKKSPSLSSNSISNLISSKNNDAGMHTPKSGKAKKKGTKKKEIGGNRIGNNCNNVLKLSQQSILSNLSSRGLISPINYSNDNNTNSLNSFNNNFMKSPTNYSNYDQNYEFNSNNNDLEAKSNRLTDINNTIFDLERNIADLNRNYKNLMIKLNTSISQDEANNLKRNINIIANNLQDQSEKLIDLKNQQQELLKNSIRV